MYKDKPTNVYKLAMGRHQIPDEENVCKFRAQGCTHPHFLQGSGERVKKCRHQATCTFNPANATPVAHTTIINDNSTTISNTNTNLNNNNSNNNNTTTINNAPLPFDKFGEEDIGNIIDDISNIALSKIVKNPEHAIAEYIPMLVWFNQDRPKSNIFITRDRQLRMLAPDGTVTDPPSAQEMCRVGMEHYDKIVDLAISKEVMSPIAERLNEYFKRVIESGKPMKISRYSPFHDYTMGDIDAKELYEYFPSSVAFLAKYGAERRSATITRHIWGYILTDAEQGASPTPQAPSSAPYDPPRPASVNDDPSSNAQPT